MIEYSIQYTYLALAARVTLVVLVSETASKRIFSHADRRIQRWDRCAVMPVTLEMVIKLVLNARAVGMMK